MAIFVKKVWNEAASVFPTASTIRLSASGKILTVMDANGSWLARFTANTVERYWVGDESSLLYSKPVDRNKITSPISTTPPEPFQDSP